jgi:hypothetical protein
VAWGPMEQNKYKSIYYNKIKKAKKKATSRDGLHQEL